MTAKHSNPPDKRDILSLWATGRVIDRDAVPGEFELMKTHLNTPLTVKAVREVCEKSGTHLLKIISPRVDSNQCCLYFNDSGSGTRPEISGTRPEISGTRPEIFSSVPANYIPFSKVLFHPFEIAERSPRSVVDDIMNPDEMSDFILDAFADAFGKDVLEAACDALLDKTNNITELPSRDFPIVFAPRENGDDLDDLQLTPISPASAFRGVQVEINALYKKKKEMGEQIPDRFCFEDQLISSKPQNISPMINGTRRRLMARMPSFSNLTEAEIHNFMNMGVFPRWRNRGISSFVMKYVELLGRDIASDSMEAQPELEQVADRLIQLALDFVQETKAEIRLIAGQRKKKFVEPADPNPVKVLLDCLYEADIGKVYAVLTGPHFQARLATFPKTGGIVA